MKNFLNKINKKATTLCFAFLLSFNVSNAVNFDSIDRVDETLVNQAYQSDINSNQINVVNEGDTVNSLVGNINNSLAPVITSDEMIKKGEGMAWDVVLLLMTISKPISIIGFIAGGIYAIFGAFFLKSGHLPGVFAMVISALTYGFATNAPEIVSFFSTWMQL
ncbi:MAG: hypothetical protein R3Y64_09575 [Peptostreptococcaceae bacterium]